MTCELCTMQATHLKADADGVVHYYCGHHAPKGATKIGEMTKKGMREVIRTYRPLIIIFFVILFYVLLRSSVSSSYGFDNAMQDFMGGFFIIFGALPLYRFKEFQQAFKKYDLFAGLFPEYAKMYPFILLFFGLSYHVHMFIAPIAVLTIVIFGTQTYSIIKVLKRKENITCACVGTAFALPLSWVTVGENAIMILMALLQLIFAFH